MGLTSERQIYKLGDCRYEKLFNLKREMLKIFVRHLTKRFD
jgi:hypothetical protein